MKNHHFIGVLPPKGSQEHVDHYTSLEPESDRDFLEEANDPLEAEFREEAEKLRQQILGD